MNEDSLRNLLKQVSLINDKYEEIAKITGENFNIFNILGVRNDEVKHSRFLAELLNPNGTHGMKHSFLKLFCEHLGITDFDSSNASVTIEKYTGRITENFEEGGNIDIIITDTQENAIIIENKIYAPDQKAQLSRYHKHGTKEYKSFRLYYLTLDGKDASDFSKVNLTKESFKRISYAETIIDWMERCKEKSVDKALLRETIVQYINLIKHLTNQLNNKQMEQNISKVILSSKENFTAAESVVKSFEEAKSGLLDNFWTDVNELLLEKKKSTWFHPNKQNSFSLGIKTDLEDVFFFVEPLNGRHFKSKFNSLFIGIFTRNLIKKRGEAGPYPEFISIHKIKNKEGLEYIFNEYSTFERILPDSRNRKEEIEHIVSEILNYINSQETQELLNQFKIDAK